jgi:hypothetical protein
MFDRFAWFGKDRNFDLSLENVEEAGEALTVGDVPFSKGDGPGWRVAQRFDHVLRGVSCQIQYVMQGLSEV